MRFRPALSVLIVASLALTACSVSGDGSPEPARPTPAGESTTIPPTTSTTAPFTLESAPDELTAVVDAFYHYAMAETSTPPPLPPEVLDSIKPSPAPLPSHGVASVGRFAGESVAVVEVGPDLFLAGDDGSGWQIFGGEWPSIGVDAEFGQSPRLVAVIGSDARPGEVSDRARADSIHIVGLTPDGEASIVGIPRDSYVPIPGRGKSKINSALAAGGPELMMETLADLTDLPFEGYVLTGFAGFESLIGDVLGGVTVDVPVAINDRWAHVDVDAGVQLLAGAQALGFARARKTLPGGDVTRSGHQGLILIGVAGVVAETGPLVIPQLLEMSEPLIVTNIPPRELLTIAVLAGRVDLSTIDNVVAPGTNGTAGEAAVVFLTSGADDLWADLVDGHLED